MNGKQWHGLPTITKTVLFTGVAAMCYLLIPDRPTFIKLLVYLGNVVVGVLAFQEVRRSGGRMTPLPGWSQPGRLVLRTVESACMVLAMLVVMGAL